MLFYHTATDRCVWCSPPCGGNGPALRLSAHSVHYEMGPSTVNQGGGGPGCLKTSAEQTCDGEQPVLSTGRPSECTGTASYMTAGGLCLWLCHLGSEYSTAAEETHHKPECHVYVQPKEVCHVLSLWAYRHFHQSQILSQDTFFKRCI